MTDEAGREARGINDEAPAGSDPYSAYDDFNLPSYVGLASFQKLPWITDAAALAAERPDVAIIGAPFDDAVSHRPGARFGPRAIRQASYHSGAINSLQLGIEPYDWLNVVDAGDAPVTPMNIERAHAVIERKVFEVAQSGAIPIILGGDHSITYPSATAVARHVAPRGLGIVHFDAHADAANSTWGTLRSHGAPMRRPLPPSEPTWRSSGRRSTTLSATARVPASAPAPFARRATTPAPSTRSSSGSSRTTGSTSSTPVMHQ